MALMTLEKFTGEKKERKKATAVARELTCGT